jgi:hypothetical protein
VSTAAKRERHDEKQAYTSQNLLRGLVRVTLRVSLRHWTPHPAPPTAMRIMASSPAWQNIAHDKKQQGATHSG